MGRRLLRAVLASALILVALVSVALAVAAVWRLELAGAAARHWLAEAGFPEAELTVVALGWRRAVVEDLDLGPGAPAADRLVLDYRVDELWAGTVAAVSVVGPRAEIDLDSEAPAPWLEGLRGGQGEVHDRERGRGPAAPALPVGQIGLDSGELRVRGFGRPARVAFDGRLQVDEGALSLALEGEATAMGSQVSFTADVHGLLSEPTVALALDGSVDAADIPWPAASALRPDSGTLALAGRYTGEVPDLTAGIGAVRRAPPPGRLELDVGLRAWRIPGITQALSGQLSLRSGDAGEAIIVNAAEPLRLEGGPGADTWRALGLSEAFARELAAVQRLVLTADPSAAEPLLALSATPDGWQSDARFRLQAAHSEGTAEATIDASVRHDRRGVPVQAVVNGMEATAQALALGPHVLERLRFNGRARWDGARLTGQGRLEGRMAEIAVGEHVLGGVVLDAPLSLRTGEGLAPVTVRLADRGLLSAAALPGVSGTRLEAPLEITLLSGEATLSDGVASGRLRVAPGRINGVAATAAGNGTPFEVSPGTLELVFHDAGVTALRLIAGDARLRLPGQGLVATGVSADVSHAPLQGLSGRLALGRVSHDTAEPAFAPMQVSGEIAGALDGVTVTGTLGPAQESPRMPFRVTHDTETGRGAVELGPARLTFSPGALTPADLAPRLTMIENTTGELRLEGALSWGDGEPQGRLKLAIADADFDVAGVGVTGLDTDLAFTGLLPPQSAPDQRLTVRELRAGLSLTDIRARFQVAGEALTAPPAIELAELEADFAGGALRVADTRLDLASGRGAVTVRVADVALERLLAALGLGEEVTGEGRLSGRIPVRLEAGGIVVADGSLRAGGPGRLRVRLRETGRALGQQAREMALMIQALEDFRYEVLAAELERAADGEMRLALRLEGSNPDVLEGHPFRFNITLSGNLDPVFRALRLGSDIGAGFLREHLQLR